MKNDDQDDVVFEASDDEGAEHSVQDKLKKLREKLAHAEKEKQEYLDGWQRARADYANLQKLHTEEKTRFKELFKESFIEDLLPTVDSFQMAFSNKEAWEQVDANWRKGVEYIYQQLMNVLESHGLKLFGEIGDAFDPMKYEAVGEEQTDNTSKDHTVAKVVQKGYMLGGTVTRPARVIVYTKQVN